jgi:hypothetical protein
MPATNTATILLLLATGSAADLNSAAADLETGAPRFTLAEVKAAGQARIDRDWENGGRSGCRAACRLLAACTGYEW